MTTINSVTIAPEVLAERERCAAICDQLGDAEFALRMKTGNAGIATLAQRHYMKCAAAIRGASA